MQKYVIYYRVSTKRQGDSGLGLEAQRRDVELFLANYAAEPYEIIGTFTDIDSGSDDDRPELTKAQEVVRKTRGAELLVAKLDRLSRRVSFISGFLDDKRVGLRVAVMPNADKFQLHIYAALAEQEREFISKRTKEALRAAKDRGVRLGAHLDDGKRDARLAGLQARNEVVSAKADVFASKVARIVRPLRDAGETLQGIAEALNDMGQPTARGGSWTATAVRRVLGRAGTSR